MSDDDWGPADFGGGSYPGLGTDGEPAASGKRARRTFNKQKYALEGMAAGIVKLSLPKGAGSHRLASLQSTYIWCFIGMIGDGTFKQSTFVT